MCGGDGEACLDCARVPFGDSRIDRCDKCDAVPENDCRQDCKAVWGGTTKTDRCGVCGGNDSCVDCAGLLHGQSRGDKCGVCDTDSADDCVMDCLQVREMS